MDDKDIISESEYQEYKQLIKSQKKRANETNIVIAVIFVVTLILSITLMKFLEIPWGFVGLGVEAVVLIAVNIAIFAPLTKKFIAVELYEQELEKQQRELEKQLQAEQEQDRLNKLNQIKKTVILEAHTTKDNTDVLNRGVVGGLIFGPTGAIIGTETAQEHTVTTFLIVYNDDSRETKTVENGSSLYNHYIKFLDI